MTRLAAELGKEVRLSLGGTTKRAWALAAVAAGLLAACEQKKPPPVAPQVAAGPPDVGAPPPATPPTPDIVVGEVSALSGPEASYGTSTHQGIELAVAQINARGGVKGRKLRVRVIDDEGRVDSAAAAVERLATLDKVALVLGEAVSTRSIAMATIAEEKRLPMITHASTSPKVTEGRGFVFRVCFVDGFQGYAMARFARETLNLGKVAVLKDVKNDYSVGLAQSFTARFKAMGGKVVKEESYGAGDRDFAAQVASLKAASPEALYLPGYYGDIGPIVTQARAAGLAVPLLGGDGWTSEQLVGEGGQAIEGSYFTNHYSTQDPSPGVQEFVADFRRVNGALPDSFAALGYDAMRVAADAIARAASLSGEDVRDAIAATKDFQGVTGSITIDAKHNATKPAVVLKVQGGAVAYQTTIAPEPEKPEKK